MFQGQDFGFCGPSYPAPMVLQDAQDTINFYIEQDPEQLLVRVGGQRDDGTGGGC